MMLWLTSSNKRLIFKEQSARCQISNFFLAFIVRLILYMTQSVATPADEHSKVNDYLLCQRRQLTQNSVFSILL